MSWLFNPDFYPTPKSVIDQMLVGENVFGKTVLEPSAGKGNIVEYLKSLGAKVIACEKEPQLRKMLDCPIIGDDFLEVKSEQVSHVDYIIANPPFSTQEQHILHMWEIAPAGCVIITLCNASLLDKRSRYQRQILELTNLYGYSVELGNVFTSAERKTDVEVAMLKLYKPKSGENEFDDYFDMDDTPEEQGEGVMSYSVIREYVNRYVAAVKNFDHVQQVNKEMQNLIAPLNSDIHFHIYSRKGNYPTEVNREEFKKELQKAAWKAIFAKMDMQRYTTKSLMEELNRFIEKQVHVPFTVKNVWKVIEMVVGTHDSRMQRLIVEIFDKITERVPENKLQLEGWKTNSEYIVNRKFILPTYDVRSDNFGGKPDANYNSYNNFFLDDLTKALCQIMGSNYKEMPSFWPFMSEIVKEWGTWYNFGYVRFKCYKKGTVHVEFQTEEVWGRFNQVAAKAKGFQLASKFTPNTKKKC